MLKSIKLKNFKSHENSELKFSSGINAIIGNPNKGKTNIVRAMRKLVENRPSGGDFLFDGTGGEGVVEITGEFDDAKVAFSADIFTDKEGKKKVRSSEYKLEGYEKPFSGMNKNIPDAVKKAINFSELNIQGQLDAPFLITSSAGEVAKTINRITKQEEADQWVKEFTSSINLANRKITDAKKSIGVLEDDLIVFADIDKTQSLIERIEEYEENIITLDSEIEVLDALIEVIPQIEIHMEILEAEKYIIEAEDIDIEIEEINILLDDLERYVENEKRIAVCEKKEKVFEETISEVQAINEEIEDTDNLIDILKDFIFCANTVNKLEEQEEKKRSIYINEIIKDGKCPFCFTKFGKDKKKIIEHMRREI